MHESDLQGDALSAWIDGELDETAARRIEAAAEADASLAAEARRLAKVREALRGLPRTPAPEDFVDRVLEAAARQNLQGGAAPNRVESPLRWARTFAVAALVLISLSLGVLTTVVLWRPGADDQAGVQTAAVQPAPRSVEPDSRLAAEPSEPVDLAVTAARAPRAPTSAAVRQVGGALMVVIRTDDVSSTTSDVITMVLLANQLVPQARRDQQDGSTWLVPVPPEQMAKVRQDLSALPSRLIRISEASEADTPAVLSWSTDNALTAEERASFTSGPGSRQADSKVDAAGETESARTPEQISRMLAESRELLEKPQRESPDGEPAPVQTVRPVIIQIMGSKAPDPAGE